MKSMIATMDLTPEGPRCITDKDALIEELDAIRSVGYSWDQEEFVPRTDATHQL